MLAHAMLLEAIHALNKHTGLLYENSIFLSQIYAIYLSNTL